MANYRSATDPHSRHLVDLQIQFELDHGHYVATDTPPTIISALGAIPKPGTDKVRLIHDCSRPVGQSLNDFASLKDHYSFQSMDDAVNLLTRNCYLAKVDLQHAYRSIPIHPDDYSATGLKWTFSGDTHPTYMFDTRLPFGARMAPQIFHRITQAIKRIMHSRGYLGVIVYLDDFLIIESTEARCKEALFTLIRLLRELGLCISWNKVEGPTQSLTFLGIGIDTVDLTLHLPRDKLLDLKDVLVSFTERTRASRRQLQQLAGKLNWACQVVRGGRTYLRRVLDSTLTSCSP